MGKIFYIMGKSASGKDKIYGRLAGSPRLDLIPLILYTTRPIRHGEIQGKQYFFVDEDRLKELEAAGKVIEKRCYDTVYGVWTYFTVDDSQIHLEDHDYLGIGTLESYEKMQEYFGKEKLCPIYIEVEDGERLSRALKREGKQEVPKYAEMCRRFLADCEDFSEENIARAGIKRRFENVDLEECIRDIEDYILDIME
ncbi:MAG: guanylate kinase [Blautia sp.]|jgi:guanylate kinase